MSLASILRSLGGRETPPPIPRKRRFDAEMPDLPDDMMAEQDYDPQDLDPTQGIGRSEDLYQDKGPQKMTPISEDIPENGPPPFGPDKPPSRFRQAAMAAIPARSAGFMSIIPKKAAASGLIWYSKTRPRVSRYSVLPSSTSGVRSRAPYWTRRWLSATHARSMSMIWLPAKSATRIEAAKSTC